MILFGLTMSTGENESIPKLLDFFPSAVERNIFHENSHMY
jgi:hypothetical protein